ncbi:hypothetical protein LR48_Vigan965s000200 [Vigna angularis]|uniref:Uncharacterized protein n=1 Tax=Phaseolus angularis TaxID=3914 RepID=A0A0L9TI77_PHAAN|nr:hypothetical protein LR48_Vigan965s000200 [Vigna angularis]
MRSRESSLCALHFQTSERFTADVYIDVWPDTADVHIDVRPDTTDIYIDVRPDTTDVYIDVTRKDVGRTSDVKKPKEQTSIALSTLCYGRNLVVKVVKGFPEEEKVLWMYGFFSSVYFRLNLQGEVPKFSCL